MNHSTVHVKPFRIDSHHLVNNNNISESKAKTFFSRDVQVYAYVYPDDKTYTVHLCPMFWTASDGIEMDCQVGTLIHEVSHFNGTEDYTYESKPEHEIFALRHNRDGTFDIACHHSRLALQNAQNLEYQFELDLQHTQPYVHGKYGCCGTTEKYSICPYRIYDFVLTDEVDPATTFARNDIVLHSNNLRKSNF